MSSTQSESSDLSSPWPVGFTAAAVWSLRGRGGGGDGGTGSRGGEGGVREDGDASVEGDGKRR